MKRLGKIQLNILRALRDSGPYPGRWMWDGHRTTVRLLESVQKRGLVESYNARLWNGQEYVSYSITEAGLKVVNEAFLRKH